MNGAPLPALTPELLVSDLPGSLAFYLQTLGFRLLFERPEAGFAAIALGEAALMLEQIDPDAPQDDPWTVRPLDRPWGAASTCRSASATCSRCSRGCLNTASPCACPQKP